MPLKIWDLLVGTDNVRDAVKLKVVKNVCWAEVVPSACSVDIFSELSLVVFDISTLLPFNAYTLHKRVRQTVFVRVSCGFDYHCVSVLM